MSEISGISTVRPSHGFSDGQGIKNMFYVSIFFHVLGTIAPTVTHSYFSEG